MNHLHRFTRHMFILMLLLTACGVPPIATAPPTVTLPTLPSIRIDEKVDVGGYGLYLHCEGTGSPTVVLEHGLGGDWQAAWTMIFPRIQPYTQVCAYSRAGMAGSDPAPQTPRTSQHMVKDLHTLLANAHIPGPYVLVGHSIAGFNLRLYASEYPQEVVGMVMVDCSHPDQNARFLELVPAGSTNENTTRETMLLDWTDPTRNPEQMDLEASAAQVRATGSLGDIPLIVLTAASGNQTWVDMQTELANLSSHSTHVIVPGTDHFIQQSAPGVVADAILTVLDATDQATFNLDKLGLVWNLTETSSQISAPQGIAVDAQSNVYVIDSGHGRVQKFDPGGASLGMWGKPGAENGQFQFTKFSVVAAAAPLVIDRQGNVFVADPLNHRIQKFDANGQVLAQWGTRGDGDGQFQAPYGLAVDANGNVYVSDFARHDVQKFNAEGQFLVRWGGEGTEAGQFEHAGSIAVNAEGNVYVVDYGNNRIQKFDGVGNLLMVWGTPGSANGQFDRPVAVAVDRSGNVYVLDDGNQRIQKFDANGLFLTLWLPFIQEGISSPLGLAIDHEGYIYISDLAANRVLKLKPQ